MSKRNNNVKFPRAKKWKQAEDELILANYLNSKKYYNLTLVELKKMFDKAGFQRSQDAIRNRAYVLRRDKLATGYYRRQDWLSGAKWGYFDIETTGFKANFGHMLSWAMYVPNTVGSEYAYTRTAPLTYDLGNGYGEVDAHENGEVFYDVITRGEAIDPKKFDKRITKSLLKAIDSVDIVVGYYSTRFDVPFVRTRALYHGLRFPGHQEKIHLDLYYRVRSLLKLGRNTLDQATSFFGIEGKNHVRGDIWNAARVGDQEALTYVLNHNVEDVQILAELHNKIGGFRQIPRRSL
jgi:uncharacterized protein YprB with RNaseH-like and TPR domain